MNGKTADISEIAALLKERNNLTLLCHIRPDGDTVGSAYALKYALEAAGKRVNVSCADGIPKRLGFITELSNHNEENEVADGETLVCAIDVAEAYLLGANAERYGDKIDVKIDHHGTGSCYAKLNYIDGDAAACGEIIYRLICELERLGAGAMTKSAATALYAAISSDTGCFKYSNVTAETMHTAARLIEAGAESYDVCHRLFEVTTKAELAVRQYMLTNVEYYRNGSVAILVITDDFKKQNGVTEYETGGVVSEMREIEGVELAITLKQEPANPQKFKISMRSSLNVSASKMCAMFGGGGHERAAGGAILAESPEVAKREVLEKVLLALDK